MHILNLNIDVRLFNLANRFRFCEERLFFFLSLFHFLVNLVTLFKILVDQFLNLRFNRINWNIIDNIIIFMVIINQRNLSSNLCLVSIFNWYFTLHYNIFFICICCFSLFTFLFVLLRFFNIYLRWGFGIYIFFIFLILLLNIQIFRL
jgi:hypothetical protein